MSESSLMLRGDQSDLLAALVSRVAHEKEIRAILIKGRMAQYYGYRANRISADVDVLVHPHDYDLFLAEIARFGWRAAPASPVRRKLSPHADELMHDMWPCLIDAHRYYPGFTATADYAFDVIWRSRVAFPQGGLSVNYPDYSCSLLISGLHALRTPVQSVRMRDEYIRVTETVAGLAPDEMLRLVATAADLGALDTARPLLRHTHAALPAPARPGSSRDLDAWRLRTGASSSLSAQAFIALRSAARGERARSLLKLLWPSAEDLTLDHPGVKFGFRGRSRLRLRRVMRGVRSLPGVLRGLRTVLMGRDESVLDAQRKPDADCDGGGTPRG